MRAKSWLSSFLVILSVAASPVQAEGNRASWTLPRLMEALSKAAPATVRFVEERHFKMLSQPLILEGTLRYADGRLEKRTVRPEEELAVIEGGRMRISSAKISPPRTVSLSDIPALDAFIASLRATLDGDIQGLKRDFWVRFKASAEEWRMTLTPLSDEAREDIDNVVISGHGVQIASIEINERAGDRTVIRIRRD